MRRGRSAAVWFSRRRRAAHFPAANSPRCFEIGCLPAAEFAKHLERQVHEVGGELPPERVPAPVPAWARALRASRPSCTSPSPMSGSCTRRDSSARAAGGRRRSRGCASAPPPRPRAPWRWLASGARSRSSRVHPATGWSGRRGRCRTTGVGGWPKGRTFPGLQARRLLPDPFAWPVRGQVQRSNSSGVSTTKFLPIDPIFLLFWYC